MRSDFLENLILQKLNSEFDKRKQLNFRYSLRAFANSLGVSPGTLSQILNNKKHVSPKVLEKIYSKLNVTESSFQDLKEIHTQLKKRNSLKHLEKSNALIIEEEVFSQISDWHYLAILELVNTVEFKSDAGWIAQKLGLDTHSVKSALDKLIELELLVVSEEGEFFTAGSHIVLNDKAELSAAFCERQKQILNLVQHSLSGKDHENRCFNSMTVAIDKTLIPEVQKRIRKFKKDLRNFILKNSKEVDNVCEIHVGVIKLTKD